ncbi:MULTISPECIES: hypothetical protein [Cohnella]|jgi:hypothetical protein|uniref:hypothetical protein n=1 Tax=Cohnella TaxID=329857 RepID=UPI000E384FB9|nr:hypothetical protein [Cohnella sp.]REK68507.1 MAG: hypothetical protein C6P35_01405 [Cohnella sp.]
MAVVVCPWCQTEILTEEGQEPDKVCPVCENELDGYRTLRITLDKNEEDEPEEPAAAAKRSGGGAAAAGEEPDWERDAKLEDIKELEEIEEKAESLLDFEETVEKLLDEQETVPECPVCHEYMLEAGEIQVGEEAFKPRVSKLLYGGGAVLGAPFAVQAYVCPSCFAVHYALSEEDRIKLSQRLSGAAKKKGRPQ